MRSFIGLLFVISNTALATSSLQYKCSIQQRGLDGSSSLVGQFNLTPSLYEEKIVRDKEGNIFSCVGLENSYSRGTNLLTCHFFKKESLSGNLVVPDLSAETPVGVRLLRMAVRRTEATFSVIECVLNMTKTDLP